MPNKKEEKSANDRKEQVHLTIVNLLKAHEKSHNVHLPKKAQGKGSKLTYTAQNTRGTEEGLLYNVQEVEEIFSSEKIKASVKDHRKDGDTTLINIDISQKDFDKKLENLVIKSQDELIEKNIKNTRKGVHEKHNGKLVSPKETASYIVRQINELKSLAKELGVENIVQAEISKGGRKH